MEDRSGWMVKQLMGNRKKTPFFSCCHGLFKPSDLLFFSFLGLILLLNACSPRVAKAPLPLEPPQTFSFSGEEKAPEKWWTAFGDPQLNILIQDALQSNFDLLSIWQQFLVARAVVDRESSYLLPDIEASFQGGTSYPQPDFVGGENMRMGLIAEYEVDLWGRIRSRIAAEGYRAEAGFHDYQAAAISLSAEISRTWFQLLAALHQLELIEEQLETNEKILRLIKARFGIGQIRAVDILRQQQLIESSRQQKVFLESRIELLEHQLAVLLGFPPQEELELLPDFPDSLPELPPLPQTGIPAELVQRRPDVQLAFNLLQAADREVAAAISNQYPRFSISAAPSVRANNAEQLFQEWAYSLAGNLTAPLFYGGRLSAEVDRTEAVKKQRLYEYGQTILIAFREVEDALIQEKKQLENLAVLEEQLALAEKAYEQLRVEYFHGISDYLATLTALSQAQALRRELIEAKLNLLEYRIALYRALAGGFEIAREGEKEQ